jgi:hypothetical protein
MNRTPILQLCNDVAAEIGLSRVRTLFAPYNEGDTSDAKLRRALTQTSRFVHKYWNWPVCYGSKQFKVTASGPQPGVLPMDFDRLVKGRFVDLTQRLQVVVVDRAPLPIPGLSTPLRPVALVKGGVLEVYGPSTSGGSFQFDYIRDVVAQKKLDDARGPEYAAAFMRDDDTSVFDDELMHLGMKWALLHRDGNHTNEDYQAFVMALGEAQTHQTGDGDLNLGARAISDDGLMLFDDGRPVNYSLAPWGQ